MKVYPKSYKKKIEAIEQANSELAALIGGTTLAGSLTSETFTATAAQTDFALTDTDGTLFLVVVENVPQTKDVGYTLTSTYQFSLTSGATVGDTVTAYYYKANAAIASPMNETAYAALTPVAGTLYFVYADS